MASNITDEKGELCHNHVYCLEHEYWQRKIPRSFKHYLDCLARAMLLIQPSNGPKFASVYMDQLLSQRNDELGRLPSVSYLEKLKNLVDIRDNEPVGQDTAETSECCGASHEETEGIQNQDQSVPCPCNADQGKDRCEVCFPLAFKVTVVKPPIKLHSSEVQTCPPWKDQGVQANIGTDEGTQVNTPSHAHYYFHIPCRHPASSPPCSVHDPSAGPTTCVCNAALCQQGQQCRATSPRGPSPQQLPLQSAKAEDVHVICDQVAVPGCRQSGRTDCCTIDEQSACLVRIVEDSVYDELEKECLLLPETLWAPSLVHENTCNSAVGHQEELLRKVPWPGTDVQRVSATMGSPHLYKQGHGRFKGLSQPGKAPLKPNAVKLASSKPPCGSILKRTSGCLPHTCEKNNSSLQPPCSQQWVGYNSPSYLQYPPASQYGWQPPTAAHFHHCSQRQPPIALAPNTHRCCHVDACSTVYSTLTPIVHTRCVHHQPCPHPPSCNPWSRTTSKATQCTLDNVSSGNRSEQRPGQSSGMPLRGAMGGKEGFFSTKHSQADTRVWDNVLKSVKQPVLEQEVQSSGLHSTFSFPTNPPPSLASFQTIRQLSESLSDSGSFKPYVQNFSAVADNLLCSSARQASGGRPVLGTVGRNMDQRCPLQDVPQWIHGAAGTDGKNSAVTTPSTSTDQQGSILPREHAACFHHEFGRGSACLLSHCPCLNHLLRTLRESSLNREDRNREQVPVSPPGKQAVADFLFKADIASCQQQEPHAVKRPKSADNKALKAPAQKARALSVPHESTWKSGPDDLFLKDTHLQHPPSPPFDFGDFRLAVTDYNPDTMAKFPKTKASWKTSPNISVNDAMTQWSEQEMCKESDEETCWSLGVEFDSKSNILPADISGQSKELSSSGNSLAKGDISSSPMLTEDQPSPSQAATPPVERDGQNAIREERTIETPFTGSSKAPDQGVQTSLEDYRGLAGQSGQGPPVTDLSECSCPPACPDVAIQKSSQSQQTQPLGAKDEDVVSMYTNSQVTMSETPDPYGSPLGSKRRSSINVNISVHMDSTFDSNAFMEQVKRHISDAIDQVRQLQRDAPSALGSVAHGSVVQTVRRYREDRLAERSGGPDPSIHPDQQRKAVSAKREECEAGFGGLCEVGDVEGSNRTQGLPTEDCVPGFPSPLEPLHPNAAGMQQVSSPQDADCFFPRRLSKEKMTKRCVMLAHSGALLCDY